MGQQANTPVWQRAKRRQVKLEFTLGNGSVHALNGWL
jgi:hypothetical protein